MSSPFKIPKRRQSSDVADLVGMQSPLSKTHDRNGPVKKSWGQSDRTNRNRPERGLDWAERASQPSFRDTVKARLGLPIKENVSTPTSHWQPAQKTERHATNHRTSNAEKSKWNSQSRTATAISKQPPHHDFPARWRPKRASDRLQETTEDDQPGLSRPKAKMSQVSLNSATSVKSNFESLLSDHSPERETPDADSSRLGKAKCRSPEAKLNGSILDSKVRGVLSPGTPRNSPVKNAAFVSESSTTIPDADSIPPTPSPRAVSEDGPSRLPETRPRPSTEPQTEGVRRPSINRTSWLSSRRYGDGAVADGLEKRQKEWKGWREMQRAHRSLTLRLTLNRTKKRSPEPIVLSSEEDEGHEDEECERRASGNSNKYAVLNPQTTPEENRGLSSGGSSTCEPRTAAGDGSTGGSERAPSIMELSFVSFHAGTVQAKAGGNIVITDAGITIPLKDPTLGGDEGVSLSLVASQLQGYGVWDGGLAQGGSLLKGWEGPAPSLLFLWVSEAQARLVHTELSAIQPVTEPGVSCPFLLLVLTEPLGDLQAALLASMLDVGAYRQASPPELCSPLSWADGLALLHGCRPPLDTHLLGLLGESGITEEKPGAVRAVRRSSCHQTPASRLIQYPSAPCKGRITVTTEDLACLEMGVFLNDVIIDFYLKYLLLEQASPQVAERCHVFSSFFHKQLTRHAAGEEENLVLPARERRHQRVKTWTRHVDIFDKDFLFIPVNQSSHWFLVVVCFPGLESTQYEEWPHQTVCSGKPDGPSPETKRPNGSLRAGPEPWAPAGAADRAQGKPTGSATKSHKPPECTQEGWQKDTVCKRPCILVMDSLKLSYRNQVCQLLRDYLHVEWKVRRGTLRLFTSESMRSFHCKVPLQDNSSDCGLYLLQYAESFLLNPVVHFDLPLCLEHWFPRQQVWRKRQDIRSLVMRLHENQQSDEDSNR